MPDFPHPPYNVTQPRVLQRWLDINAQNGALGRTRGFITIPPLTIPNKELFPPYIPDKLFQLNYQVSNNFSLIMSLALREFIEFFEKNMCLFIVNIGIDGAVDMFGNNIVTRFRLSENSLPEINAPIYTGQVIHGKHFQIEFWDRHVFDSSEIVYTGTTLPTSVRGNIDYRYGVDYAIEIVSTGKVVLADFQNTNPNVIPDTFNLPLLYKQITINGLN